MYNFLDSLHIFQGKILTHFFFFNYPIKYLNLNSFWITRKGPEYFSVYGHLYTYIVVSTIILKVSIHP